MKSGKVYSLALLALACLAACGLQPSKCSRQLSDVRAYQEQEGGQISSDNENGIDAENSQGKTGNKTINGLEVPGKLTDRPEQILKRVAYTASYNSDLRIPNWVAWQLTGAHTEGKNKRAGVKFHEDTDVPMPRAVDFDYVRSGYDRGHL